MKILTYFSLPPKKTIVIHALHMQIVQSQLRLQHTLHKVRPDTKSQIPPEWHGILQPYALSMLICVYTSMNIRVTATNAKLHSCQHYRSSVHMKTCNGRCWLLCRLKSVAKAKKKRRKQYKHALSELEDCPAWQQHAELHSWFENNWLAKKKVTYWTCIRTVMSPVYSHGVQMYMQCFHLATLWPITTDLNTATFVDSLLISNIMLVAVSDNVKQLRKKIWRIPSIWCSNYNVVFFNFIPDTN